MNHQYINCNYSLKPFATRNEKKKEPQYYEYLSIPFNIFQYLYLVLGKLFSRTFFSICSPLINPFHTSGIFLCPPKTSESFSRKEISSNKQKSLNLTASFYPSGKNGFVKRYCSSPTIKLAKSRTTNAILTEP